jgi:hypothetical protein
MKHVFVCFLLLGCGKHRDRDCGRYAQAFADALRPDPSRRLTVIAAETHACESHQVSDEQMACVYRASDENDIRACMGQTTEVAKAGPITIAGVEGGGVPASHQTPRQQLWLREFAHMLAICEPKSSSAPTTFDVVATYGSSEHIDVSEVPEEVRACVARAFHGRRPPDRDVAQFDVPIRFHLSMRE